MGTDDVHIGGAGLDHKARFSASGANSLQKGSHQRVRFVAFVGQFTAGKSQVSCGVDWQGLRLLTQLLFQVHRRDVNRQPEAQTHFDQPKRAHILASDVA